MVDLGLKIKYSYRNLIKKILTGQLTIVLLINNFSYQCHSAWASPSDQLKNYWYTRRFTKQLENEKPNLIHKFIF